MQIIDAQQTMACTLQGAAPEGHEIRQAQTFIAGRMPMNEEKQKSCLI